MFSQTPTRSAGASLARLAVLAVVTLSACSTVPGSATPQPGAATTGRAAPGLFNEDPATVPPPSDPNAPPPNPAACELVSWDDLPAEVKVQANDKPGAPPSPPSAPKPRPVKGDPDGARCLLDNSILGTIYGLPEGKEIDINDLPKISIDVENPQYFILQVDMGDPASVSTNAGHYPAGVRIDLDGRFKVVQSPGIGPNGEPTCIVASGTDRPALNVSVSLTNGRFPAVDACGLVRGLASKVASRVK